NPPPPLTQPEVVQIDIDFDGTMMWNGTVVPDQAALDAKLAQVAAEPVQAEIHLLPNKLVPYKDVAAVLAAAQRIGAIKIGLIGNEQYMQ
ncbi:MAG: biopolymer transporter ExbD, partial [Paraburkholderia sp.]